MKLLLLCVGLTLVCAQRTKNPVVTKNFDLSRITGSWHSILLASDQKDKIVENGSMRVFVKSMDVWENGTLYLVYNAKENGVCIELSMVCDKTENNGEFSLTCPDLRMPDAIPMADCLGYSTGDEISLGLLEQTDTKSAEVATEKLPHRNPEDANRTDDGYNRFHIVETDYTGFLIFHLVNTNYGKTFQTMELYARRPNASPTLKAKFVKMCEENGIVAENVLDLTLSDRCLQARESGSAPTSRLVISGGLGVAQGAGPPKALEVCIQRLQ